MSAGGEQRRLQIRGIHHITLICSDLERSVAFYQDTLGMRVVKRTVNADDPNARHFFFGDAVGTPGTVITCMEYPQMEEALRDLRASGYRVGNRYRGQTVGVRVVGDTVQIALDDDLLRTHRSRHDKTKEFGALGTPNGRPRRTRDVA